MIITKNPHKYLHAGSDFHCLSHQGMATHSSISPWKIPSTEEPGWLQPLSHRVSHDWAITHALRFSKWDHHKLQSSYHIKPCLGLAPQIFHFKQFCKLKHAALCLQMSISMCYSLQLEFMSNEVHIDQADTCCPINFSPQILSVCIENFKHKSYYFKNVHFKGYTWP